jgi:glycosyltransferase involved in cell wall biosynthesis
MEHSEVILSVLICTLKDRKESFNFIRNKLRQQISDYSELPVNKNIPIKIDLQYEIDNGEMTIGEKRNKLLLLAQGEYVCFVDDDDDISDDYIESIMDALETKPDCVGIEGILKCQAGDLIFRHSIQFQCWYTGSDAFYRTPNHLNPVKRKVALNVCFPSKNFGEDQHYSDGIKRQLKTEKYIDHPIYFYNKPELGVKS